MRQIAAGVVEFFQTASSELADELFDPAYRSRTQPLLGDDHTREGLKRDIRALRAAIPDAEFAVEAIIAQGDKVCLRWRMTGTHRGPLLGVQPSGARVGHYGQELFTVARGRIVSRIGQEDRLELEHKLRVEWERTAAAATTR